MMLDINIFKAIIHALTAFKNPLALMVLARPDLQNYQKIAQQAGIKLMYEAFADRAYDDQGCLLSRTIAGAVLKDKDQIIQQVKQLVDKQTMQMINGEQIKFQVDSVCVHGDNSEAILLIQQLRQLLTL